MNKMFNVCSMFFYSCIIKTPLNFLVKFQDIVDFNVERAVLFFVDFVGIKQHKNKQLIKRVNITFNLFKLNLKQQSELVTLCQKLNNPIQFLSLSTREVWNYRTMKVVI